MLIYIINYLSIPVYSFLLKDKRKVILLVCAQMFLILAFRSTSLGFDMRNYETYFNEWSQYSFSRMVSGTRIFVGHRLPWGLESGYVWLNWLCAKAGIGFRGFLAVHTFISMFSLGYFLRNNARNSGMALALIISLGIFQSYFYILRQMLALSVLLFSVDAIKERKLVKFLMEICVAVLFHRAAAVCVLLYFLYGKKINKNMLCFVYAVSALTVLAVPYIYNGIVIPILKYVGKADLYPLEEFQPNNMIILMAMFLLYIWIMANTKEFFRDEKYRIGFWGGALALLIETFSLYVPVISRIAITICLPFAMPMIADVAYCQKNTENKYILQISFYVLLFMFYLYQLRASSIVPYLTFWQ